MPNLKLDLLNYLKNEKFYEELELARLAQEPNMNYRDKVNQMSCKLEKIAVINAQVLLIEQQYFVEPVVPAEGAPVPQPVPQSVPTVEVKHQGQTHGE